jgi:hypothetical protein
MKSALQAGLFRSGYPALKTAGLKNKARPNERVYCSIQVPEPDNTGLVRLRGKAPRGGSAVALRAMAGQVAGRHASGSAIVYLFVGNIVGSSENWN